MSRPPRRADSLLCTFRISRLELVASTAANIRLPGFRLRDWANVANAAAAIVRGTPTICPSRPKDRYHSRSGRERYRSRSRWVGDGFSLV